MNGELVLPNLDNNEISELKDTYQHDQIELPFSQSNLTDKLEALKANGNELLSAKHEMQGLYAQRTIERLKKRDCS